MSIHDVNLDIRDTKKDVYPEDQEDSWGEARRNSKVPKRTIT